MNDMTMVPPGSRRISEARKPDSWDDCLKFNCERQQIIFIVVSAALVAIAAVATYFCLVKGLMLYDLARSSLQQFGAGFLIYSGIAFSIVAVGNALWCGGRLLNHSGPHKFKYETDDAKYQIGLSLLAPIAAIPFALVYAAGSLK